MMNLEYATLLFLIGLFIAAEVYRARRGVRGVIVGMNNDELGLLVSPVITVRVRLRHGEEINAGMNCCTACLGNLGIGDEVRVSDSRDGFVVDLPWFRSRSCIGQPICRNCPGE